MYLYNCYLHVIPLYQMQYSSKQALEVWKITTHTLEILWGKNATRFNRDGEIPNSVCSLKLNQSDGNHNTKFVESIYILYSYLLKSLTADHLTWPTNLHLNKQKQARFISTELFYACASVVCPLDKIKLSLFQEYTKANLHSILESADINFPLP